MSIHDAMINSLRYGTRVQKEVRNFIECEEGRLKEDIANAIAKVCSDFKNESERDEIPLTATAEEKKVYRKRINNIINDVSRICREMIGFAIVNAKRTKGVYEYKAVPYIPKSPWAGATIMPVPPTVPVCGMEHFDPAIHIMKPDPNSVIEITELFGGRGSASWKSFMWTDWSPEDFISKITASGVNLEEVAKLLLVRLKGRAAA